MVGRVQQGEQGEQGEQGGQDMGVDAWAALAQAHGMVREFNIVQRGDRELTALLACVEVTKTKQAAARRSFLAELGKCFDASTRSALFPAAPSTVPSTVPPTVPPAAIESHEARTAAAAAAHVARVAASAARIAAANKAAENANKAAENAKSILLKASAAVAAADAKSLLLKASAAEPKAAEPKAAEPKAAVPEPKAAVPKLTTSAKAAMSKTERVLCTGVTVKGTPCTHGPMPGLAVCKKHTKRVLDDDGDDTISVPKKAKKEVLDLSDDGDDVSTDSEDECATYRQMPTASFISGSMNRF